MIEKECLIGHWYGSNPGDATNVLHLERGGTGFRRVVEINRTTYDQFEWFLSSSATELVLRALQGKIENDFLSQGTFKLELKDEIDSSGRPCDVLILSVWHEASVVEGGGTKIEYPAGWGSVKFWRLAKER